MATGTDVRAGGAYVEITSRDAALARGLARARAKLRAFAASVSDIGQSLLRATAIPLTGLGFSVRTFMGFSDQMREAQAVTGATAAEFSALNEQAKELGRTTSWTAQQVAQGMTELGRAGFKPTEIENAIPAVLNLGRATRTELATAAEIAGTTMRGFALEASQATRVADVLAATANISATDVVDLGEAFKYLAPQAVEAGETLEDTAAALAVLANNGIKGALAGNALARAYKNLAMDDAQKKLAEIGVEAVDSEGNLRKLADVIAEIGKATSGMGTAQRLSIFESLFGRGQAAALKLAGGTAFGDMRKQLEGIAGTAARTAATMDDDLGGAWRRMARAAEGVQIAIGEAVSGTLARYMEAVTATAGRVVEWVQQNRGLVVSVTLLIGKIAALGVGLIAFAGALKIVTAAVSVLMFALSPVGIVFAAIAAAVAVWSYALSLALDKEARLSTEMRKNREEGDAMRRVDQLRMERLGQLAEKTKLNNDEQREAADLIAKLKGRYGDLGISIDETTGAVEGMSAAQEKLNAAMKMQAFNEILSELAEVEENIKERTREAEKRASSKWQATLSAVGLGGNVAQIEALNQANLADMDRREALIKRLEALHAGDAGAVTGEAGKPASVDEGIAARIAAANAAAEEADKELAQVRDRFTRQRQTAVENEIADLRKLGDEYTTLLEKIIKTEEGKKNADKDRIAALKAELADVNTTIGGLIAGVQARAAQTITDAGEDVRALLAGISGDRQRAADEATIGRLIQESPRQAVDMISEMIEVSARSEEKAKAALTAMWDRIRADNKITDDERRELDRAKGDMRSAAEQTDRYQQLLENAQDAVAQAADQFDVRGMFAGRAASLIGFGDTTAADKTADATQKTADNTRRILERIESGTMAFA